MQAERQAACGRGVDLAAGQDARSGRHDRPQPPLHGPFCALIIKHALSGRAAMCHVLFHSPGEYRKMMLPPVLECASWYSSLV